ncbi:hypothetical protein [Lolliginicoccus suaedae]|uniref:hypothetical protein n=1 Tax=Lolliginicoccus suaedae TaxID=2605429 RepID=UPI0011EDF276|nr:hypothetical protein [Lolliginicoccus suaedae]
MLSTLPGKYHHERFETLNRTIRLFSANGRELAKHLAQFIETPRHVDDLTDDFEHEAIRLFHNFIASVATLRDSQRTTHRKIWTERIHESERVGKDDLRTKWEVDFYKPKVDELLGDDDIKFLFDLRNCTLHHTVPLLSISTTFSHQPPAPPQWANTVKLKRAELDKFSGWSGPAKRFLRTCDKDVEFLALIDKYSMRAQEFYGWFWDQVKEAVKVEVDEYHAKSNELQLWLAEELILPEWKPTSSPSEPVAGSLFRNRARAHLERSAFGTSGWRKISVDSEGSAVIGESDWEALPAVGKYLRKPSLGD